MPGGSAGSGVDICGPGRLCWASQVLGHWRSVIHWSLVVAALVILSILIQLVVAKNPICAERGDFCPPSPLWRRQKRTGMSALRFLCGFAARRLVFASTTLRWLAGLQPGDAPCGAVFLLPFDAIQVRLIASDTR